MAVPCGEAAHHAKGERDPFAVLPLLLEQPGEHPPLNPLTFAAVDREQHRPYAALRSRRRPSLRIWSGVVPVRRWNMAMKAEALP